MSGSQSSPPRKPMKIGVEKLKAPATTPLGSATETTTKTVRTALTATRVLGILTPRSGMLGDG